MLVSLRSKFIDVEAREVNASLGEGEEGDENGNENDNESLNASESESNAAEGLADGSEAPATPPRSPPGGGGVHSGFGEEAPPRSPLLSAFRSN